MKMRTKCSDPPQLRHFWRLSDNRKALSLAHFGPFCSSRRFSASLWGTSRGPKLWQQFAHPVTHLLQGRLAMSVFPWAQCWPSQIACENQEIVGCRNQMTPLLKLRRSPHPHVFPKQRLFVETIAMFLAKAMHVRERHDGDIGLLITDPNKPTDAWIGLDPILGFSCTFRAQQLG